VADKQALTTGEAAKYCGVNFRTVIRWIERGHLDAYKLPGRGDNRIPVDTFVDFLRQNDMPVPDELVANDRRLLLFSLEYSGVRELAADLRRNNWDVVLADDPVQLGYLIVKDKPSALLMMDSNHADIAARIMKEVSKDRSETLKMALLQGTQSEMHDGWDSFQWPEQRQLLLDYLARDGSESH
jgi:excisionase family DNA binding protein